MDGTRFDNLVKRLATRPMTRATALRGLAASAAALTGVSILAGAGEAANNNNNNDRKRKVCKCTSATATSCSTVKKEKKKAKRILRRFPCSYKGKCRAGVTACAAPVGCSPANNTQGTCAPGQLCNTQAICVAGCTGQNNTQGTCPNGQLCVNGQCQGQGVGCNPANNTQGSCPPGQVCNTRAICVTALGCLNTANPQCSTNQFCCPSESASAGECRGNLQAC